MAVVIPAYNESKLLGQTLQGLPEYVDLIVVVDDASEDETAEVARTFAKKDGRIQVISHRENAGVGAAILTGYAHAAGLGAQILCVMAGDNQMDPAELETVIDPVASGQADYAKGNRLGHRDIAQMPWPRRLGTMGLGWVTGWIAGWPQLRDPQCGYTALCTGMFLRLPVDKIYPRYGYPNDLLLRLSEQGARLAQPVVRPVYADEVSGFKIHHVVVPIGGILCRGALRRLGRLTPFGHLLDP